MNVQLHIFTPKCLIILKSINKTVNIPQFLVYNYQRAASISKNVQLVRKENTQKHSNWISVSRFTLAATHMASNALIIILLKKMSRLQAALLQPQFFVFFKKQKQKKHSLFQALGKKRGAARVHPHGALNNCHKVQSGNGSAEIGARGEKSSREASVRAFFCLGFSVGIHLCKMRIP